MGSIDAQIALLAICALFFLFGTGIWIGMSMIGVSIAVMWMFAPAKPAGDAMATVVFSDLSSWTLTALPLFIWMGEVLFRTAISEEMFRGLAPWMRRLPGRLVHTNIIGCTIFAAVSGSSAATCATIGKMTVPELRRRGYPDAIAIGSLSGAGTLGLLIPPSLIMIVYGVQAEVSIAKLFAAGIIPGILLAGLMMAYVAGWSLLNPIEDTAARRADAVARKAARIEFAHSGRPADPARAGLDLCRRRHRDRIGGVRRDRLLRHRRSGSAA